LLYVLAAVAAVLLVGYAWLRARVVRGGRRRDEALVMAIGPVGEKLARGLPVPPEEMAAVARTPQLRVALFPILLGHKKLELFPKEYLDEASQAESQLAYWLMHPNEAGDAPEELQPVEVVTRPLRHGPHRFHVLRYRMPAGHWAAEDGWLLGIVGPFADGDAPYVGPAGAFSRMDDKHGQTQPAELVDWYISLWKQKGAPW
jgi:hypothetical protein